MNTDELNTNVSNEQNPTIEPEKKTKGGTKAKPSGFNTMLRKIGFGFLFLLLGALIVGLALYLPANSNLRAAEAELERLLPIESAYEDLLVEHEELSIQRLVYKILANANQMHIALLNEDSSRVAQYRQYIEDDLSNLSVPDFPDISESLQKQFSKVTEKRTTDKSGAIEALQVFQNDLIVLIDNL